MITEWELLNLKRSEFLQASIDACKVLKKKGHKTQAIQVCRNALAELENSAKSQVNRLTNQPFSSEEVIRVYEKSREAAIKAPFTLKETYGSFPEIDILGKQIQSLTLTRKQTSRGNTLKRENESRNS